MRRVAVFVEGLTEEELLVRFVRHLAGLRGLELTVMKQHGGKLKLVRVEGVQDSEIYLLLVNCCNDEQVKTQIIEQHPTLTAAGYDFIVGLRDVRPLSHADVGKLSSRLPVGLPPGGTPIRLHLAVLETEAWFLDEWTHFLRISPQLTDVAVETAGYSWNAQVGEQVLAPAEMLHQIYAQAGFAYKKSRKQIARTVDALSFEHLYVDARARSPSLDSFASSLEQALFP
jgi:hypothetical protein